MAQKNSYQLLQNINPSSEVSAIEYFLQDAQGLMWMGTDQGLYSYNGYTFQSHYRTDSIEHTRIHTGVFVSPYYLYLGSDNGILIYNTSTDCYEEINVKFPKNIRAMTLHNDNLWIGTLNGLYIYHLPTKQIYNLSGNSRNDIPHQAVYSIAYDNAAGIYIGTYNGLCKYNILDKRFEQINISRRANNKSNQFINTLLNDSIRNCIWIGMEGELLQYYPTINQFKAIPSFDDLSVKSLAFDKDRQLLVGTDNGLYVYDDEGTLTHVTHDSRNAQSLINNIIWGVYTDKDGNSWIGTDHGISLAKNNTTFNFTPITQLTGKGDGNQFHVMYKDSHGTYWFGGTNGLLMFNEEMLKGQKAIWFKMNDRLYPIAHNRIRDIFEDKDGVIWIATDGGIHRFDLAKKQFKAYSITDKTGLHNSNWAYQIYEDNHNRLWIATYLGGVFAVDKEKLIQSDGQYQADIHYLSKEGLADLNVNQLVGDQQGNIWVLFYNKSIQKINPRTGDITTIELPSQTLSTLMCDKDGFIWGAYRGGVLRIHPTTHKIDDISTGPVNNQGVLAMEEVDDYIWVSTTDGVYVVNKKNNVVNRLNLSDMQFTSLFYDTTHQKVLLGGVDGFATTTPMVSQLTSLDRPILLTDILINNESLIPINGSIRRTNHVDLKYNQNNIGVQFTDLPYDLEKKNSFVYKLSGLDEQWNVLASNTNQIQYNNLIPGDYTLIISKLGSDGKPTDNQYSLDIHITPPWYASTWARIIYALILITITIWTISFFRMRNRLLYERKEKAQILEQSKQKMEFLANLSHDIKTPLSLVIAPISKMIAEQKNGKDKRRLEDVQRNAIKLNALIHQIVDINRIDNKANNLLILSHIDMVSYVKSIFDGFEETAKERNISFEFQSNYHQFYADIDLIKWESIIGNLLSNAFKYTSDGGNIQLKLNVEGNQLNITIVDSGIGIPQQELPYVFQRFFQSSLTKGKKEGTGIGLYLVKTYTELHGGIVAVDSKENSGTTFRVSLPVTPQTGSDVVESNINALPNSECSVNELNKQSDVNQPADEAKPLILVVEDNNEVAQLVASIIGKQYRYKIAGNGQEGLALCTELHPDLIVTDYMMPIMDGMEMARNIRKHVPTSTIPIILLTGKDDKQTELESIRQQINAFIAKPFDHDLLLSRINQLLNIKETIEAKTRIEIIQTPQTIEAMSYDEQFLIDITNIIEEHIDDSDLNVNALSTISNINNKQLYRKLKQLTGETPVDYIKSIRMKKAAMLLEQKKFTVAEVMYMVGFSNHSYFSKCFQSKFGKTPKQFIDIDNTKAF